MEHDANFTPWVLAARDSGATVRYVDIHPEDCTLDLDDLRSKLTERTKLVALGCASNAVGTINPFREIAALVRATGALLFLDAVHYAPHATLDVETWDCDFSGVFGLQVLRTPRRHAVGPAPPAREPTDLQAPAGGRPDTRSLDARHPESRGASSAPRRRSTISPTSDEVTPDLRPGAARPCVRRSRQSGGTRATWPTDCCAAWTA